MNSKGTSPQIISQVSLKKVYASEILGASFGILFLAALDVGATAWLHSANLGKPQFLDTLGEVIKFSGFLLGVPAVVFTLRNHRRSILQHQQANEQFEAANHQRELALEQQRWANEWKQREYVAQAYEKFAADPRVRLSMVLLDYTARYVELQTGGKETKLVAVTSEMVTFALIPHHLRAENRYTQVEVAIRDAFDAFFDGVERFGAMTEAELIKSDQLSPYFDYWLKLLTSGPRSRGQAFESTVRLYLTSYDYRHVKSMLRGMGIATENADDQAVVMELVNSHNQAYRDVKMEEKIVRCDRTTSNEFGEVIEPNPDSS